jgi:hypothetical protein
LLKTNELIPRFPLNASFVLITMVADSYTLDSVLPGSTILPSPNLTYLSGLRSTVLGLLSDSASPQEVSRLISLTQAIAIMLLRHKRQTDFVAQLGGIRDTDLAMDCIADLFRRDERGSYVALKAYFGSLSIAEADDAELAVHLRRLVSSAVNQGVFRVLGDIDPGLSKIIRNIKSGVNSLRTFTDLEVRGEACIAPILADPLLHLPFMNREELTSHLVHFLRGGERTPDLLAALAWVLRDQSGSSRAIPLVRAALAFREVLALKETYPQEVAHVVEPSREMEFRQAIEKACQVVFESTERKYLQTKGLPKDLLDCYFDAVHYFLISRLDGKDEAPTLFESLRAVGFDIAQNEYRRTHRQRLEYLTRLVQKETRKIIEA